MPDEKRPSSSSSSQQPQQRRSASSSSSKQRPRRRGQAVSPEESQLQKHEIARHESRSRKRKTDISQLNLTSMIDVIFLLLIYFVVTATFVEDEGVLIAKLPTGSGQEAPPEELPVENININITSYDQTGAIIEVGAQRFSNFRDLTAYLISIQNNPAKGRTGYAAPDNPIIIRPGGEVRWQHVVNAFNSSVRAAYTNVSFAQTGGA
ncbi:MAG: hypothetical protein GVY24_05750 [Planctomycetes bacterium]|jgi:biopolymer transport protein ExbD|nr:hypothetical protein [Planctomycetota bacterium]